MKLPGLQIPPFPVNMLYPDSCQGCVPLSFWNQDRSITSLHNFTQHHHSPPHSLPFFPCALLPSFTGLTHHCHKTILGLSNERGLKTVAQNVFHPPTPLPGKSPIPLLLVSSLLPMSQPSFILLFPKASTSATVQRDSQPLCRLYVCLIQATAMCTCGLPSLGTKSSHEGLPVRGHSNSCFPLEKERGKNNQNENKNHYTQDSNIK